MDRIDRELRQTIIEAVRAAQGHNVVPLHGGPRSRSWRVAGLAVLLLLGLSGHATAPAARVSTTLPLCGPSTTSDPVPCTKVLAGITDQVVIDVLINNKPWTETEDRRERELPVF